LVESGSEALSLAKNERFDLFLIDNWMPEMTGPELTRFIREFNQTTPILFYSGAAFEDDKEAAVNAGAQGYLIKPIGIERLIEEVERLIGTSKTVVNVDCLRFYRLACGLPLSSSVRRHVCGKARKIILCKTAPRSHTCRP
jgi:CheY-like chemotaxis protein